MCIYTCKRLIILSKGGYINVWKFELADRWRWLEKEIGIENLKCTQFDYGNRCCIEGG